MCMAKSQTKESERTGMYVCIEKNRIKYAAILCEKVFRINILLFAMYDSYVETKNKNHKQTTNFVALYAKAK